MQADQIRQLHIEGKTPTEIAAILKIRRSQVYPVLGYESRRRKQKDCMEEILREVKQLRAEIQWIKRRLGSAGPER